ncbi:MAG: cysteine hydrolase family protein [Alphaproteobacteria bacterium]|nr:hydrolase [Hyphomonas sp.]MBR9807160.1 cysteine hydrolase family protein [Alphaproteobacteria bacterium]|tara:strand:- start:1085 stop:1576 length:492 start_codon:yes stop_codon:yes gene_type:complete
MKAGRPDEAVLIIDVQPCFEPPAFLVERAQALADAYYSVATVELHDETKTPFLKQLNWAPPVDEKSLIKADRTFIKHGYAPPVELVEYLRGQGMERVYVCGIQADTCVLAAGFALFDAGLQPTLVTDAIVGSSLDRSGQLGARLWEHHFGSLTDTNKLLGEKQ